ncbi:hypothetical protein BGZ46_001374 [Entomortierella lignicola]|nr:hypothetical protein BGZ46_001374 [Entomortierella lignicola]
MSHLRKPTITYFKYAQVCARAFHNSLREDVRLVAVRRSEQGMKHAICETCNMGIMQQRSIHLSRPFYKEEVSGTISPFTKLLKLDSKAGGYTILWNDIDVTLTGDPSHVRGGNSLQQLQGQDTAPYTAAETPGSHKVKASLQAEDPSQGVSEKAAKLNKERYDRGIEYYEGRGVTQDYRKAFELFLKAANQGDAESQFLLGRMFETGQGVAQDYSKALEYFQKASTHGCFRAYNSLGLLYKRGLGVTRDYVKAAE